MSELFRKELDDGTILQFIDSVKYQIMNTITGEFIHFRKYNGCVVGNLEEAMAYADRNPSGSYVIIKLNCIVSHIVNNEKRIY